MVYDESSKTLAVRELAVLSFRRSMELGMLAVLSGGLALAIGFPMRFHVPQAAKPIIVSISLALILLLEAPFFWLRRSPSADAIERLSKAIEAKRQKGAPVGALSRTFIALAGLLAFALGVMMVLPIELG